MLRKIFNIIKAMQETKKHNIFIKKEKMVKADKIFTHLTNKEKRQLFYLAQEKNNGFFLEIGSYLGASACFIAAGINCGKVICIDTWGNDAMTEGVRDTKKEFEENTAFLNEKIIMIQGYSTDTVEMVKSITCELDFLFIDGDHSYIGCKSDWDLYYPLIKTGGCIVFHDYGWAEGVKKVVEEAKNNMSHYDSLPNMFWGYKK